MINSIKKDIFFITWKKGLKRMERSMIFDDACDLPCIVGEDTNLSKVEKKYFRKSSAIKMEYL